MGTILTGDDKHEEYAGKGTTTNALIKSPVGSNRESGAITIDMCTCMNTSITASMIIITSSICLYQLHKGYYY